MRHVVTSLLFFCAVTLFAPPVAKADMFRFDAATDFSTTENSETSMWSYRYKVGNVIDGNYPLMPTYGSAQGDWTSLNPGAWNAGILGGNELPYIGVNRTGTTVENHSNEPGDNFSVQDGTLFMRPATGYLVVLSWLSPFDVPTRVRIDRSFGDLDETGGDGAFFYKETRLADGTQPGSGFASVRNGGGGGTQQFTVNPGERVNFILRANGTQFGSDADDQFDAMRLSVTITPEPSTLALAALGTLGLLLAARRKR